MAGGFLMIFPYWSFWSFAISDLESLLQGREERRGWGFGTQSKHHPLAPQPILPIQGQWDISDITYTSPRMPHILWGGSGMQHPPTLFLLFLEWMATSIIRNVEVLRRGATLQTQVQYAPVLVGSLEHCGEHRVGFSRWGHGGSSWGWWGAHTGLVVVVWTRPLAEGSKNQYLERNGGPTIAFSIY